MKRLLSLAIVGAVALSAQTAAAQAQIANHGPVIPGVCVYNNDRMLVQSQAGQSLNEGLRRLLQEVEGELQPYATMIQNESQAIQQLPEDQRPARIQALQQRVQEAEQLGQQRDVELRYTRGRQIAAIGAVADPIIVALYQERGCSLLISQDAVHIVNPQMDITPTVIERLNAQLPTLGAFVRETPPPQQQQQ